MTSNKIVLSLVTILIFFINNSSLVQGLPSWCFDYYSEFSLDQDYNPTIYPEVNTTITDITTLYKISEVIIYTVGLGKRQIENFMVKILKSFIIFLFIR